MNIDTIFKLHSHLTGDSYLYLKMEDTLEFVITKKYELTSIDDDLVVTKPDGRCYVVDCRKISVIFLRNRGGSL